MPRIGPALLIATVLSLSAYSTADAQTATVPSYFFSQWTVAENCSDETGNPGGHTQTGLQFVIAPNTADSTGQTALLQPINSSSQAWPAGWQIQLSYRPGTQTTTLPADFACVPGQEASSPFLAMSGFVSTAEPYYPQEHWYGLTTINGQLHHVLIFPLTVSGPSSSVILLIDAETQDSVQLDHGGSIVNDNK